MWVILNFDISDLFFPVISKIPTLWAKWIDSIDQDLKGFQGVPRACFFMGEGVIKKPVLTGMKISFSWKM
jgi:hypothetical protein